MSPAVLFTVALAATPPVTDAKAFASQFKKAMRTKMTQAHVEAAIGRPTSIVRTALLEGRVLKDGARLVYELTVADDDSITAVNVVLGPGDHKRTYDWPTLREVHNTEIQNGYEQAHALIGQPRHAAENALLAATTGFKTVWYFAETRAPRVGEQLVVYAVTFNSDGLVTEFAALPGADATGPAP